MTEIDDLELEPMPEGEEEAPPLTHTMAIVRWVIFAGMCLFATVMVLGYFGLTPWAAEQAVAQQYHCPMHPTYVSNQPGECPICGMSLVPIGERAAGVSSEVVKDRNAWMLETQARNGQYGCPMDPEVVSDSAGRCPICNMTLVKVNTAKIANVSRGVTESTVPGLVPVMLAPQRVQSIGLTTALAEMRSVADPLRLVGYVTPDETRLVDVQVRATGWIQELYVDETGQKVEKGQPLLSLYSPELYQSWQDYQVARKAELLTADSSMKVIKHQVTEASRRRLRFLGLNDSDIDEAGGNGSNLTLRSPFSGYVLSKSAQSGQYIGPGQSLLTVADLSVVWVVAEVYEHDLGSIRVGDSAAVKVSGVVDALSGRISYLYPTISADTRTTRVRIELENHSMALRPGMYAEVSVANGAQLTLAVPADALLDGGETQYVFVVHDGTQFVPRRVTIGHRGDDWVEVLSGLSAGESVVTSANFLIDSESRLQAAISGMGGTETTVSQPAQH